jgi:signal transduction histidine kinase
VVSLAIDKSLTNEALKDANEKLESLDKLKTEFLSLAAHQLRSPLTAIRGYSSMLLDGSYGAFEEKQREAINRVFESSTHLSKVVEDLLNVSKIEAGGMKYEMALFDMEKAAKDLATDLSITAEKKGLKLNFTTDGKIPYNVNGDMEKIRQVVLNLIDNAIKYTMKGSVTVSLTKNTDINMIKLSVTDTGMGISSEEKEKLFQKFARGAGGKTNTTGSGLGLYLARQIAEAHGGHIVIDSPGVGLGSTFSLELKAA